MVRSRLSFSQWVEFLMARGMQFLPIDLASAIGARLGRRRARQAIKLERKWVARLHRNFEQLEGIADPLIREQRIVRHIEHIGRLYAEYPVLHKIARKRLSIHGAEHLHGLTGPAIFVSAHTGHWELIAEVMRRYQIPVADLYDPIPNKIRLQLAMEVRRRLCPEQAGNRFIPASSTAVRELVGWLKSGGNLVLFIDEEKDGLVWSPALGRALPFAGNRALAARLAARYRVPLIPLHIQRKEGAEFDAVIESPMMPGTAADLANQLNDTLEGWLKEDYGRWYWLAQLDLDKRFPQVDVQKTE